MTGKTGYDSPAAFLGRVGKEAPVWSLRALPLPGGLVLLEEGLSGPEHQRFLLLLSSRIGPPGLAPILGETAAPSELRGGADDCATPAAESCQVTVEERRQLFGCFQMELSRGDR
ncbi:MAG: hypothetical protein ACNA74_04830 [Desulfurivibrio sp.]